MASINLKGYLREPLGETSGGNKIVFTHVSTTGEVIAGSRTSYTVEANGYYDIDIEYGNVAIETSDLNSRSWQYHGTTTINQDTTATTLPTLLNSFVPPTDDQIILFQDLVKDAEDARDASEASAVRSEAAAQSSIDNSILMNEQQARAAQMLNLDHFDASGMVNMGKHYGSEFVNEGIWIREATLSNPSINTILLGRPSEYQGVGTSKTGMPVTHIAGAVINILGLDLGAHVSNQLLLPEAEDGTRIYDSTGDARGSGKASLDLKVDVDPKYGDVPTGTEAQILREAVGRAFEGECPNGDFRNGTTLWTDYGSGSILYRWAAITSLVDGREYTLSVDNIPASCRVEVFRGNGFTGSDLVASTVGTGLSFTADASTHRVRISFLSSTPYTEELSIAITSSSEEVVTHPVDLLGLEYYEEELTGVQEVFECIQSLSTTFGDTDVPTVLSTRKLSYFQQYDGQFPEVTADPDFINDRYRCVVWGDLTNEQKRKVAAYMGEKLFVGVNGNIVNGRLRAMTVRGFGNGNWQNVDSTSTLLLQSIDGIPNSVHPQGVGSIPLASAYYAPTSRTEWNNHPNKGVFTTSAASGDATAYQGRCFMYVVATVPRANKGAYHEDLNPYGCKQWNRLDGADGANWYSSLIGSPTTMQQAFIQTVSIGELGAREVTGYIGRTSGHPDGILYDGIEAGGLNGVIDWRLGAVTNDSPEEAAKVEAKVENGTYRGLESLQYTKVGEQEFKADAPSTKGVNCDIEVPTGWDGNLSTVQVWLLEDGETKYTDLTMGRGISGWSVKTPDATYCPNRKSEIVLIDAWTRTVNTNSIVVTYGINLSVSGEFKNEVVFSDPSHLLVNQDYKDGWQGVWGGIPAGDAMHCVRKVIGSERLTAVQSVAPYTEYTTVVGVNETDLNETPIPLLADIIYSFSMKNFAKQTKPSTSKPVYNAKSGLLGVTVTQSHDKSVLAEAVAGVILKSDASGIVTEQSSPVKFLVNEVVERITSLATDMVAPTNSSQAIKIAIYQISENGQVSLGFIANTMTHNGTDWGELDEIIIPFGDLEVDTFNDANGILQTTQSTMTAIPMGWTSNHARAGSQVEGVDL